MIRSAGAPDPSIARERYRDHAAGYDASCRRTEPLRRATVAALQLQPGDVVLDAGSGTGMSFGLLQQRRVGKLLGIELSPDMMALAHEKVDAAGWSNVTLLESTIEGAAIPYPLDAVLCFYTHDVMRSEASLDTIFAHTKPGARVAVAGMKLFPWWLGALNLYALAKAKPYMTTFEGLRAPWSLLQQRVPNLRVRSTQFGMGYIAHGTFPG